MELWELQVLFARGMTYFNRWFSAYHFAADTCMRVIFMNTLLESSFCVCLTSQIESSFPRVAPSLFSEPALAITRALLRPLFAPLLSNSAPGHL